MVPGRSGRWPASHPQNRSSRNSSSVFFPALSYQRDGAVMPSKCRMLAWLSLLSTTALLRQARGRRLWQGLFCPRNQAAIPGKGSWSNVLIFRSLPCSKLCVTELFPCQQSYYGESCSARVLCPCKPNHRIEALINNQKGKTDKSSFWRLYPKSYGLLLSYMLGHIFLISIQKPRSKLHRLLTCRSTIY